MSSFVGSLLFLFSPPFPAQAVVASTIAKALIMLLISFINLFGLFVSMLQR
uniref:Uncharacterized protein n=1 Tax=virus sp. ctuWX8 TaxID=2826816 RepID=A0A8S5R8B2_9VIRU|nr:MAG TPA: Protein of unknown function (DUF2633) [virus sp. ctuWX8]